MTATQSFGALLKNYRLRAIDPQTGRHLTQQRLGTLIGERVGSTYSAQAISDWERDQSQIHKDHRQVLIALIQILFDYGGLISVEEINQLLKTGNYRNLAPDEIQQVLGLEIQPQTSIKFETPTWTAKFLRKLGETLEYITPFKYFQGLAIMLCWVVTWLGIAPILNWPFNSHSDLTRAVTLFTITNLTIPIIIAWAATEKRRPLREEAQPLNIFLLRLIGSTLGFNLGVLSVSSLVLISFHLYLYPWSKGLLLFFFLWPVALGYASAKQVPNNQLKAYGRIAFKDYSKMLVVFLIPGLMSWFVYHFQSILQSRILGPLCLILGALGSGGILFLQSRRPH